MVDKVILYLGQPCRVACDERCEKAWGINSRPRIQLSPREDDFAFLADGELGKAPDAPGIYEGSEAKPLSLADAPNRWCIRECERCAHSLPGESHRPLSLPDFSKRLFNEPCLHPESRKISEELTDSERVLRAIELAVRYGGNGEAHHQSWVIDQMVRILAGGDYEKVIADAKSGEDGPDTYDWDEGIAP